MNIKIKDRKNIPLSGNRTGTMFIVLRKEQGEILFECAGSFIAPLANASISDCVKNYSVDCKAISRFITKQLESK